MIPRGGRATGRVAAVAAALPGRGFLETRARRTANPGYAVCIRDARMSSDPAELIFFGEINSEAVLDEAQRLGISAESLQDAQIRRRVVHSRLIRLRTQTAKNVAAGLGITITEEQAGAIAENSLVPDIRAEPAPLDGQARAIAEELYFHAIKAALARHEGHITDKKARADARKMVAAGERGRTTLQRISRAAGCLVVVALTALGTASALLSAAAAMILIRS